MIENQYDIVIIGGGASGTALLYTLARYTNVKRLALVEKYGQLGQVNSHARNNSQTLHVGDIETHYTVDKVRQVKPAAMMVARYANALPASERDAIISQTQKMVLGVGTKEVVALQNIYEAIRDIFPELKKLTGPEIVAVEPAVMAGRDPKQPVLALFNPLGYAVNFGRLAQSLADAAKKIANKTVEVKLNSTVETIVRTENGYTIKTGAGEIHSRTVVVDADAYSLGFAKALGYGQEFSLIPIAGTFYFTKNILKGKVYTFQDPRMPFAAAHGDPDLNVPDSTRWGPTARFVPVLESYKPRTMMAYLRSAGLGRPRTWLSFLKILLQPVRFLYLAKNILFELPIVGKYLFTGVIRKIAPQVRTGDVRIAKGFGGMRLQRVDTRTHELQLGEGKIIGDKIIFNMTPSPGASVCLYNGLRDAEKLMEFFGGEFAFDKTAMMRDLMEESVVQTVDVSSKTSYSS